jgi:hypothetical protein
LPKNFQFLDVVGQYPKIKAKKMAVLKTTILNELKIILSV